MKNALCKALCLILVTAFLTAPCAVFAQGAVGVVEGRLVNIIEPINDNDAANKKYVDDSIAMIPESPVVLQEISGESETAVLSVKAIKNAIQNAVTEAINELTLNTEDMLQNALIEQMNKIYPVSSIYMSIDSTNPGTLFGGSWSAWGQGRVPLGMGSNGTTNYTTAGAIGGEEYHVLSKNEMPVHGGHIPDGAYAWGWDSRPTYLLWSSQGYQYSNNRPYVQDAGNELAMRSYTEGANGGHNNIQPYVTCYMWRRTA